MDDNLVYYASNDENDYEEFIKKVRERFLVEKIENGSWVLGVKMDYDRIGGTMELTQTAYIKNIIEKMKLNNGSSVKTPMVKEQYDNDNVEIPIAYREIVGMLQYLSMITRPDIMYATNYLAQNVQNPSNDHFKIAKRVCRYLKGTTGQGLVYVKDLDNEFRIEILVDASFGSNVNSLSQSGYIIKVNNCNVLSASRKQPIVALSSAEAEYIAMAEASNDAIGVRELLKELFECDKKLRLCNKIVMYSDSTAAMGIARNENVSSVKHMQRRFHVIRERVMYNELEIRHLSTDNQPADMLTKILDGSKFTRFKDMILGYIGIVYDDMNKK